MFGGYASCYSQIQDHFHSTHLHNCGKWHLKVNSKYLFVARSNKTSFQMWYVSICVGFCLKFHLLWRTLQSLGRGVIVYTPLLSSAVNSSLIASIQPSHLGNFYGLIVLNSLSRIAWHVVISTTPFCSSSWAYGASSTGGLAHPLLRNNYVHQIRFLPYCLQHEILFLGECLDICDMLIHDNNILLLKVYLITFRHTNFP